MQYVIFRFELETKAMLQRDKMKEWPMNPPQKTPPSGMGFHSFHRLKRCVQKIMAFL